MSEQQTSSEQWFPVIGRSLAYMCLHVGDLKEKNLAGKAQFLESLGVERKVVAVMLDSTYRSITEALSKVTRGKKGAKNGRKSKSRAKR